MAEKANDYKSMYCIHIGSISIYTSSLNQRPQIYTQKTGEMALFLHKKISKILISQNTYD